MPSRDIWDCRGFDTTASSELLHVSTGLLMSLRSGIGISETPFRFEAECCAAVKKETHFNL